MGSGPSSKICCRRHRPEREESDADVRTLCPTARVCVVKDGRIASVRALLDSGTDRSCICAETSRKLRLTVVRRESCAIRGLGLQRPARKTRKVVAATLRSRRDLGTGLDLELVQLDRVSQLRFPPPGLDPRLRPELDLADSRGVDGCSRGEVQLVIGSDYYYEVVTGRIERLGSSLVAMETLFGWCLLGREQPPQAPPTVAPKVVNVQDGEDESKREDSPKGANVQDGEDESKREDSPKGENVQDGEDESKQDSPKVENVQDGEDESRLEDPPKRDSAIKGVPGEAKRKKPREDVVFRPTACVGVRKVGGVENIRLLFDTGSNKSIISSEISRKLKLPVVRQVTAEFLTLMMKCSQGLTVNVVKVTMSSLNDPSTSLDLEALEVDFLPFRCPHYDLGSDIELGDLVLAECRAVRQELENRIHMVVGADYYSEIVTDRTRRLGNKILAVETLFGWCLIGSREPGPAISSASSIASRVAGEQNTSEEETKTRETERQEGLPTRSLRHADTEGSKGVVFLVPTACVVANKDGQMESLRVLFDTGSERSSISSEACEKLQLPAIRQDSVDVFSLGMRHPEKRTFNVVRLTLQSTVDPAIVVDLELYQMEEAMPDRPAPSPSALAARWRGLDLADSSGSYRDARGSEVHVVIGADYYFDVVTGRIERLGSDLVAMETLFGWCLLGKQRLSRDPAVKVDATQLEKSTDKTGRATEANEKSTIVT